MNDDEKLEIISKIKQDIVNLCEDNEIMIKAVDNYFADEWDY